MSDKFENSLINLGELSKPATVLVEKISDAVGGIFKPYQLVRVAKAEAQADRLRAEGQIEISDLQKRAFHRFLNEEAQKQKNIEDITSKTLPQIEENAKPDEIENDWITNFFDKCRLISDDEMQGLWSRVLAGESNALGTYSKRTVNFLSDLDKNDAELFTKFCGFVWDMGAPIPLIYDEDQVYEREFELGALNHLESIGLINYEAAGFVSRSPKEFSAAYFGQEVKLSLADYEGTFDSGRVLLTRVGEQLAPICGSKPIDGFFQLILEHWSTLGYAIELLPSLGNRNS
jgi:hypothetical protein